MRLQSSDFIRGFTIIELLIVIAIMLILTSIAIPIGHKTTEYLKLKTTGDQIKNLLKVAQGKAMADPQVHCGVYLFPGTGTGNGKEYVMFFDVNGNNLYDEMTDKIYMGAYSLNSGITLSIPQVSGITDNVIVFRGDGSAKFGGSIILKNSKGLQDSIHVLASTGRIKTFIK
jgi:prepilin-type N-terminal cleavage/methylation domain-containing protein